MSANDEAVRATNDDAASCKRSAVQLGYWTDPYIQFVTKASERKPPEISRGYYARVKGVQGLVRQFLEVSICVGYSFEKPEMRWDHSVWCSVGCITLWI